MVLFTPKTVADWFAIAAEKAGNPYRLCRILKTSQSNIHRIMSGGGHAGDEIILRLAQFLGADPIPIIILSHTEAASAVMRPVWEELERQMHSTPPVTLT